MDFFYTPYNAKFLLRKHMTFEDEDEAKNAGAQRSKTPNLQKSNELESQRREELYKLIR